jgi:hypothetical protein
MTIFGYQLRNESTGHWIEAEAYPAMIDGRAYYNVKLLRDGEGLYGLPDAPDGYLIAALDVTEDGKLWVRLLGFSTLPYMYDGMQSQPGDYAIDKLVAAGRMKARLIRRDNAVAAYHIVDETRAELIELFRSIPPELLLHEREGPFLRLDLAGAAP